jgi:hypothetical protein
LLNPQDYGARAEYRPPAAWYQRLNRLGRDSSIDDIRTIVDYYPVFRVVYGDD